FAAFNDGGIWRTTNGGTSWSAMTDQLATLSFGAVAIDPSSPATVYAGTGNIFNNGFFAGLGIYKSTDSGLTWNLTPGSPVFNGKGINKIVVTSTGAVIVATDH